MRIAIVGCGFISNIHVSALINQQQTVVRVVDSELSVAKEFAERWNIPSYCTRFDEVLKSDIDCVHICTPPMLHYDMVKQVLMAKKHVVCEKPLCFSSEQARELMQLSQDNALVAAVNFNVRYHDGCQRAKQLVQSGDLGSIHLINGSYLQEFHALPANYMWRYMPELAGPMRAVTEIGSHWIDLIRFLTGLEISEVSATFGSFDRDRILAEGMMYPKEAGKGEIIRVDSEDAAIIALRFHNGAIGSLFLSEVSHGRSNYIDFNITGSKRSVWWCSENPYALSTGTKSNGIQTVVNAFSGGFPDTFSSFFEQVYKGLESNGALSSGMFPTILDGYRNTAVCEAIFQSANNNSAWMEVQSC